MNGTTIKTKRHINLAFKQAIEERRELFNEIIADVMEDLALGSAIDEGLNSGRASEEEVFQALRSK
jgi:hypothetical protein